MRSLLLLLLFPAVAVAQADPSWLRGQVQDLLGAPWAGAHVELREYVSSEVRRFAPQRRLSTRADARGRFEFEIEPGTAWVAFAWANSDERFLGDQLLRVSELHGPVGARQIVRIREASGRTVRRSGRLVGDECKGARLLVHRVLPVLPRGECWLCEELPLSEGQGYVLPPWPGSAAQLLALDVRGITLSSPHSQSLLLRHARLARELSRARELDRSASYRASLQERMQLRLRAPERVHVRLPKNAPDSCELWVDSWSELRRLGRVTRADGLEWLAPAATWPGKIWARAFVGESGIGMQVIGTPIRLTRDRVEGKRVLELPEPFEGEQLELELIGKGLELAGARVTFVSESKRLHAQRATLRLPESGRLCFEGLRPQDSFSLWLQLPTRTGARVRPPVLALLHSGTVASSALRRIVLDAKVAMRLLVQELDGRPVAFAEMAAIDKERGRPSAALRWMSDRRGETWFFAPAGVMPTVAAAWAGGLVVQRLAAKQGERVVELRGRGMRELEGELLAEPPERARGAVVRVSVAGPGRDAYPQAFSHWWARCDGEGRFRIVLPQDFGQAYVRATPRADYEGKVDSVQLGPELPPRLQLRLPPR